MVADTDAGRVAPWVPLRDLLDLDRVEPTLFVIDPPSGRPGRLYGGEVAAQAVVAAARTVSPSRLPHAITAHYLSAGDRSGRTLFKVSESRDGQSFSVRHVEARQNGRLIFTAAVSFHLEEEGLRHQLPVAPVARAGGRWPPETGRARIADGRVDSDPDTQRSAWISGVMDRLGIDIHFDRTDAGAARRSGTGEGFFFRLPDALPDDPMLHAAGLTYLSDLLMVSATLAPHGIAGHAPALQFATLNHSLWLHAPVRADEWLYYDVEGTWTGAARGLARGQVFGRHGRLAASSAQEVLIRPCSS